MFGLVAGVVARWLPLMVRQRWRALGALCIASAAASCSSVCPGRNCARASSTPQCVDASRPRRPRKPRKPRRRNGRSASRKSPGVRRAGLEERRRAHAAGRSGVVLDVYMTQSRDICENQKPWNTGTRFAGRGASGTSRSGSLRASRGRRARRIWRQEGSSTCQSATHQRVAAGLLAELPGVAGVGGRCRGSFGGWWASERWRAGRHSADRASQSSRGQTRSIGCQFLGKFRCEASYRSVWMRPLQCLLRGERLLLAVEDLLGREDQQSAKA